MEEFIIKALGLKESLTTLLALLMSGICTYPKDIESSHKKFCNLSLS